MLPPYGYHTWSPCATSGIVRIEGRSCGFSRTGSTFFLDARPRRNGKPAAPWATEGPVGLMGLRTNGALKLDVDRAAGTIVATTLPGIAWPYDVEIDPENLGLPGSTMRYKAMPEIRRRTFRFLPCTSRQRSR